MPTTTKEERALKLRQIADFASKNPADQAVAEGAAKAKRLHEAAEAAEDPAIAEENSDEFGRIYELFRQLIATSENERYQKESILTRILANSQNLSTIFVLVLLALVIWAMNAGARPIVDQLPSMEFARGIITMVFVLFTIGFAAIVLIYGLFRSDAFQEDRRFSRGREVLGVFMGIVGTIVGFYFGTADDRRAQLVVSADLRNNSVTAFVAGGTPPYKAALTYGPSAQTKLAEANDGWVTFVLDKASDNIIPMKVTAVDVKGNEGSFKFELKAKDLKSQGWALPESPPPSRPVDSQGKAQTEVSQPAPEPATPSGTETQPPSQ